MQNKLDQDFNVLSLLKFTAPSTIMLVFLSMYQTVDGVFVSNFVGPQGLSAVNIVYPLTSIVLAVSIMLATGSGAIIAQNMGEGRMKEAREKFSVIVWVGLGLGIAMAVLGTVFLEPLLCLLGATPNLYHYCWDYQFILTLATPLSILQLLFQIFFVTAGKPQLGLAVTVGGGVTNLVLDYLFVARWDWGVSGAALATAIGYALPAAFGLCYFVFCRKGTLYLVKPIRHPQFLLQSCANGSSEMVTNLAVAITTLLFNIMMLRYVGEDGVAAVSIVLYAQFLMTSVFMGFSGGVSPIISYNFGKGNRERLKKLFRISMGFVAVTSIFVFGLSYLVRDFVIMVFVSPEDPVFAIAKHGFSLFAVSFLVTGFNIFASSMFTAFSNGLVSAVISFLRTFVFLSASLILLPLAMEADGIWWAVPLAEAMALMVSVYYFVRLKDEYHYI